MDELDTGHKLSPWTYTPIRNNSTSPEIILAVASSSGYPASNFGAAEISQHGAEITHTVSIHSPSLLSPVGFTSLAQPSHQPHASIAPSLTRSLSYPPSNSHLFSPSPNGFLDASANSPSASTALLEMGYLKENIEWDFGGTEGKVRIKCPRCTKWLKTNSKKLTATDAMLITREEEELMGVPTDKIPPKVQSPVTVQNEANTRATASRNKRRRVAAASPLPASKCSKQ